MCESLLWFISHRLCLVDDDSPPYGCSGPPPHSKPLLKALSTESPVPRPSPLRSLLLANHYLRLLSHDFFPPLLNPGCRQQWLLRHSSNLPPSHLVESHDTSRITSQPNTEGVVDVVGGTWSYGGDCMPSMDGENIKLFCLSGQIFLYFAVCFSVYSRVPTWPPFQLRGFKTGVFFLKSF